jgi:YARHG domain
LFKYDPNVALQGQYVDYQKTTEKKIEYEIEDSIGNPIKMFVNDQQYFTTTDTIQSINPSTVILSKELVENLSKGDIHVLRNFIFAKHGYAFKDKKLRQFFDWQSWYMPIFADVSKDLTEIELKNVDLLSRYETNAKEYYRHFGR